MWFHHINLLSFFNVHFPNPFSFYFFNWCCWVLLFHFGAVGFSQKGEFLTHVCCWHMYTNSNSPYPYYFLKDLPIFEPQAMPWIKSFWMKFCSSCPLKHMQCHYGSMCLNEVEFTWAIETHTKCHHPIMVQMCLDETQFTLAISSWMKVFRWNSVHTGQYHHGSKCLDETQFTLGSIIMGQSVWMKLSSHWTM
jgi:hypothetical protein